MTRLILFNKPYGVLSQFTDENGRSTLSDFINIKNVYPAGRLDRDSEGLILLTDDGQLQSHISDPKHKMEKIYWVQVEGMVDETALQQLQHGVMVQGQMTKPAKARAISPPTLWERDPPIRQRQHIPTSWLEISIHEGRNRQVRRMTATVDLPTLRLVRIGIGPWALEDLLPGQWREVDPVLC
jgi:23S rRNA pseudouridine2457 synthase